MAKVRLVYIPAEPLTDQALRARWAHMALLEYHDIVERSLSKLPRGLTKAEKLRIAKDFAKEDLPMVLKSFNRDRRHSALVEFPQMARYSLMALIFVVMETEIHRLCSAIGELKKLSLRWNDLKGDVLDRLHTYAVKLAGIPAPKTSLWHTVRWLEQIRHCIVHANGEVARSNHHKSLRNMRGKLAGFEINSDGYIVLGSLTISRAILVFGSLMNHFVEEAGFPGIAKRDRNRRLPPSLPTTPV